MTGKKIGLDLDGVVTDYQTYFIESFNDRFNTDFTIDDWKDYYFTPRINGFKVREESFWKLIDYHVEIGAWKYLNPIEGALEGIKKLNENNSIHIITHKKGRSKQDTVYWLSVHNVDYDSISFTTQRKGHIAYTLGIDVMIEDSHKNVEDLASIGIESLLINRPWNQVKLTSPLIQRVNNWQEIVALLT